MESRPGSAIPASRTYVTIGATVVAAVMIGWARGRWGHPRPATPPEPAPIASNQASVAPAVEPGPEGPGPASAVTGREPPRRTTLSEGDLAFLLKNGHLPPDERLEILPNHDVFYVNKLLQGPYYDLVLAGDSRMLVSAAPQLMQPELPDRKIFNAAFAGLGWTKDYMDYLDRVMRRPARGNILVLSLSPPALTRLNARNNWFVRYSKMDSLQRYQVLQMGDVPGMFASVAEKRRFGQIEHRLFSNGWFAATKAPDDTVFANYTERFKNHSIDDLMEAYLLARVSVWTSEGIRVVGFRSPASESVRELENTVLGSWEERFSERFRSAGGEWLAFDVNRYSFNDGHHMNEASAGLFSVDLAKKIRSR